MARLIFRETMWQALVASALTTAALAQDTRLHVRDVFQWMDVFQLEYAADPQIDPTGEKIVYVRRSMDVMTDRPRSELWIINFDGSDHRPLVTGAESVSAPRWSPSGDRLLYVVGSEEGSQIHVRWMDTGQTARLTNVTESPGGLSWSPDGRWVAFTMFVPEVPPPFVQLPAKPDGATWAAPAKVIQQLRYRADGQGYLDDGYAQVFVLPAEGGTPRPLTSGPFDHGGTPAWTPDSRTLIISANRQRDWEYDPRNSELFALQVADGSIVALTDRRGPDASPAVSPDGSRIAYVGYDDREQGYQVTRLYVVNRDGTGPRLISAGLDRDVQRPVWDQDGRGVFVQFDDQGNTKVAYISLNGAVEVLAENVGGLSLGRPYAGGSYSVAANGRFAFTHSRPDHPADVAVGHRGRPGGTRLTRLNDDLFGHKELGAVEEMWVPSSYDGRRVHAWIVKPPGFDPSRQYPLILEIHGGPFANYGDRFAAEVQLYTAAGYVVLYVNPRGSTSYGEEFGNLIHHNYPGQDYDDLMSAVDAVIERGYVDRDNLFVTGGSGGGVLTSWIVGHTNRFRAAVAAKPVINWYSFVLTADNYPFFTKYWFPDLPWNAPEHYLKRSPLSYVGNVTTPTMLLTGEADHRTPISETEQFYQALKLRKVDAAMVRIPDASHGIAARPSHLIAKVAHILQWFARYRSAS